MLNLTLNCSDSIDTVLPVVELAMHTGEECCIRNINHLGQVHTAALALLAKSGCLMKRLRWKSVFPSVTSMAVSLLK